MPPFPSIPRLARAVALRFPGAGATTAATDEPEVLGAEAPASPALPLVDRCPSCGAERTWRFCAACGERRVEREDFSLRAFAMELVGHLTSLDHAVVRTVRGLFGHPGSLAESYFEGRRVGHIKPVQLFLLLSVVLFLVLPHTGMLRFELGGYLEYGRFREQARSIADGQMARLHLSRELYLARFEAAHWTQKKALLLAVIPVFALVTFLTERLRPGTPRRRWYVEHLVYATHFFAFLCLFVLVYLAIGFTLFGVVRALPVLRPLLAPAVNFTFNTSMGANLVLGLGLVSYLAAGARRFFGHALPTAILVACIEAFAFVWLFFNGYPPLTIFATFLAM
jgi:hypothetical protein